MRCLVARNRVWSFDLDQARPPTFRNPSTRSDAAPDLNGPSAPIWVIEDRLAISAASAATVFALAIRRAAGWSRAPALVLMQAAEYTPVGPSSNIAPLTGGSQKRPAHEGA
jgi:hypothetical protein